MKLKDLITDCLFKVYYPYIVRKEKFVATRMWQNGVKQAEEMSRETTARVYLFYDAKHRCWSPMTYLPNKQLKPSFIVLRRMGKMHGMQSIKGVDDMKRAAYYYTPSSWGAIGCESDNRLRQEKLAQWINYYMLRLSEPMRKCRQYQTRRGLRPDPLVPVW